MRYLFSTVAVRVSLRAAIFFQWQYVKACPFNQSPMYVVPSNSLPPLQVPPPRVRKMNDTTLEEEGDQVDN